MHRGGVTDDWVRLLDRHGLEVFDVRIRERCLHIAHLATYDESSTMTPKFNFCGSRTPRQSTSGLRRRHPH